MSSVPRIGIVGAGRTRNGLGPFLAAHFEGAGARVVGVSGRDLESARRAGAQLCDQLGHGIDAYADARELAMTVDMLVVVSPERAHLEGLQAALAAGVACLCEKPLVSPDQAEAGLRMVAAFAERGLLLVENCQWPYVLETMFELCPSLHPDRREVPVESVRMGLCPAAAGRAMILDTLSHVLSVVQAVAKIDPSGAAQVVHETDSAANAERNVLSFELPVANSPQQPCHGRCIAVELQLERCDTQPRPAWIEIDGCRVDRRIGEGYSQFLFTPSGTEKVMPDPLAALVYRLPPLLTRPACDDTTAIGNPIATRLRCFASIIEALDRLDGR